MQTFEVLVEETTSGSFIVEAASAGEAMEAARRAYRSGELVLEPGELTCAQLCVAGKDGACGAWEDVWSRI